MIVSPELLDSLAQRFTSTVRDDNDSDSDTDFYGMEEIDGFPVLGAGASRVVLDLGDGRVAKINHNITSYGNQTEKEWNTWISASQEARKYLIPILEHDMVNHMWSIVPFAKIGIASFKEQDALMDRMQEVGLSTRDICSWNTGHYEGRLVATDYGV